MKHSKFAYLSCLLTSIFILSQLAIFSVSSAEEKNNEFEVIQPATTDNFFKLDYPRKIGSAPSIEYDPPRQSIWVVDRCAGNDCYTSDLDPILQFDLAGNFISSFGKGLFARPHGLYIDHEGYIWVTDAGQPPTASGGQTAKGHQVFKFDVSGNLLMTLGSAGVSGTGDYHFNQPSDVLVSSDGSIYVADGHGGNSNARIIKYSDEGKFDLEWGISGTLAGQFESPHALAIDSKNQIYVADRGNGRIQLFDINGKYLEEWHQFGQPSGLYFGKSDRMYVVDGTSGTRGIYIGNTSNGRITHFIPDVDTNGSQEGVTVDDKGNIYTSSTRGMVLKKFSSPNW